jgi:hypothetical protein
VKLRLLIAIIALAVMGLACNSSGGGTPEPNRITATHFYTDDGTGTATDEEVQSFSPTQHDLHFMVQTNNLVSGHIKWVFTAVDTSDGQNVEITTVEGDIAAANNLTADLSLPRDWPTGSYKADVYLDDVLLGTVNFTVQ